MTATATTPEDVLDQKRQQLAALGSESACRSDDEREAFWNACGPLQRAINVLMNAPTDLEKLELKIAPLQSALDLSRAAETKLLEQIESARDWRTIPDRRERDAEWARQQALQASVKALYNGVEFFGGQAALPLPLRALLTTTCPTCSHQETIWAGPIPALVDQIAELQARRAKLQAELETAMAS